MHKGDALNYIYYVVTGSMEILKGGMVVAILGTSTIVKNSGSVDVMNRRWARILRLAALAENPGVFGQCEHAH